MKIGQYLEANPVVGADGTVYIGSSDHRLYAINPDGTTEWTFETGGELWFSPALAADGTVYVAARMGERGDQGSLYALSPDGTLLWEYDVGNQCGPVTVAPDSTVYVSAGAGDGTLTAVAPDGTRKWVFAGVPEWQDLQDPSGATLGTDGTVYLTAASNPLEFGNVGHLFALAPDGTLKWFLTDKSMTYAPAVAPDGTIYAFSDDGILHAVSPEGREKWTFRVGSTVYGSPGVGADGAVYFASDGGWIYAVDPDGEKSWALGGHYVEPEPAIGGDGTLYFAGADLVAVSSEGSELWTAPGDDARYASPVIGGNGLLYVLGETSLHAVGDRR